MTTVKKGALRIAIDDWLEKSKFGEALSRWYTHWGEDIEDAIADEHQDTLSELAKIPGIPSIFQKLKHGSNKNKLQGGILTAGGLAAGMGMSAASAIMAPVMRLINYVMDRQMKTARVDPAVAYAMMRRKPSSRGSLESGMQDLGWDTELQNAWDEVTKPVLPEADLIALMMRQKISSGEVSAELTKRGWTSERITHLVQMSHIIPGVQDIITMAVREAFHDGVAAKFGYDEDFPPEAAEWGEKQGLSTDWMKKYWRSHWTLPSVGQGFAMFQRLRPGTTNNSVDEADLSMLLRALDIPAFWRKRLIELSYSPLTRVDVRRMHGMGVIDEDQVYASYLDLGYNSENAQRMTEFTIALNSGDKVNVSRTAILKAFSRGSLNKEDAITTLESIGLKTDEAKFYVSLAQLEQAQKDADDEAKLILTLFEAGEIDNSETYSQLSALRIPSDRVNRLVRSADLKRLAKVRLTTEQELEEFYLHGQINDDEYRTGLIARKYQTNNIEWFIKRADQKRLDYERKEEERLLNVAEKIEKSNIAGIYRKQVARIDIRLAESRTAIADIRIMLHDIDDKLVKTNLTSEVKEHQANISALILQKAKLKLSELE